MYIYIYIYTYIYVYILGILKYLNTEIYTWRLVIVQNFYELWQFCFLRQNVLIPPSPKTSKGAECPNTPILYTTLGHL